MSTADNNGAEGPITGSWYADRFKVGQNAFEFKIDCGHETPEQEFVTMYFRIVANPVHAQELFRLLGVALVRYCDTYGLIDIGTAPSRSKP